MIQIPKNPKPGESPIFIVGRNNNLPDPNGVYDRNPDKIIGGLTKAIERELNVSLIPENPNLAEGFTEVNEQIFKYNHKTKNGVYFSEREYVKDGGIHTLESNQHMLDYFILECKKDKKTKTTLETIKNPSGIDDSFAKALNEEIEKQKENGNKIRIDNKADEKGVKYLWAGDTKLVGTKDGNIVSVNLPNVTNIGNKFLADNKTLKEVSLPNVEKIGEWFLAGNETLEKISLPNIENVGKGFLCYNKALEDISLGKVKNLEKQSLTTNKALKHFYAPKLENMDHSCLIEHPKKDKLIENAKKGNATNKFLSLDEAQKADVVVAQKADVAQKASVVAAKGSNTNNILNKFKGNQGQ